MKISVNQISINILEEIANNDFFDYYRNNIYTKVSNSTNPEIITLIQNLDKDIDLLYKSIVNFTKFLKDYIEDYRSIGIYLKSGKLANINNPNLQSIISNTKSITNIKLEDFNIPNKQININYEEKF